MDIEQLREYCLSLPKATEDMAFGEECLLLRVCGKIFACIYLVRTDCFVVKCDPERAIELRESHDEIEPAWHWNKKYWIQVSLSGELSPEFVKSLVRHSYSEVVAKMTRRQKAEFPEITEVKE